MGSLFSFFDSKQDNTVVNKMCITGMMAWNVVWNPKEGAVDFQRSKRQQSLGSLVGRKRVKMATP